ncbi:MAG TPA: hypothetical protein VLL52_01330 [Anaerolineae bacterium]|nr:hypothetical protein [Anaerolineae bacterium]
MSRNVKIALAIIGVISTLCCCLAVIIGVFAQRAFVTLAEQTFTEDPQQAAALGQAIIDYELPPGYQEQLGMNLMGNSIVFIANEANNDMIIMLIEVSDLIGNEPNDLDTFIDNAFSEQQGDTNITFSLVSEEPITVNGETTMLRTFEGTDDRGTSIRQVRATFASNNNVGQFMIMGAINSWPEEDVNQFIKSLE